MPAFFSKVFARGKEKDKEKEKGKDGHVKEPSSPSAKHANKRFSRASAQSLLEGKFEAVSPSVSPTAEKYGEIYQTPKKDKEKERSGSVGSAGGLFRPKSRSITGSDASKKQEEVPKLKLDLNLPSPKLDPKKRNLSIVYEGDAILDDEVLGGKRLSPEDALKLMRACSTALTSRGLETLGIMHPHWHSASPGAQRRIISLFLSSLTAPSEPSTASTFGSELEYARSPHDVAAVFRWALRHLQLEAETFDRDNTPSLAWYDAFAEKEKAAEYPRTAYSDLLLPAVKLTHAELLGLTLSLVSRLSSHSEWNGTSGSKLSMFFGHYLLTGNRLDNTEDWITFYSQWERAGRALEHIFLASLRDEDAKTGIPKRLLELVVNYPYSKSAVDKQFPRPTRFATRAYDALYVRVTGETLPGKRTQEEDYLPLQVVEAALRSDIGTDSEDKELVALWDEIKKLSGASEEEQGATEGKTLGNVFSDDSVHLLTLKSDSLDKGTPTISSFAPAPEHDALFGVPTANGRAKTANGSTSVSRQTSEATTSSPIASDWNVFSSAGFGESAAGQSLAATLLDSDVEKTEPRKLEARRSLKKSRSPGRGSRADKTQVEPPSSPADAPIRFKTSRVSLVKVDEAFVDFWSDALLDPISDAWPNFVVCQLKTDAVRTYGEKKITWLVIEQKLVSAAAPAPPSPARRAGSPRPSVRSDGEGRANVVSRVSASFSPRKRFNFFGGGSSQAPAASTVSGSEKRESKAGMKGVRVNELGEVIPEGKETKEKGKDKDKKKKPPPPTPKAEETRFAPTVPEKPKDEPTKHEEAAEKPSEAVVAGAAAVAVGAGALAVAADVAAEGLAPTEEEKPEVPAKDEEVKEEGIVEAPAKEAEREVPPVPEKAIVEESQAPASVTSQLEEAQEDSIAVAPEAAEPEQPEPQHEDIPEPGIPAPSAPAPVPVVEEPSLPQPVKEEPALEPAPSAEPQVEEEEEPTPSINQGAGESRFVENIEITPPTSAGPAADQETKAGEETTPAVIPDVPETVPEEPEPAVEEKGELEVPAGESKAPVEEPLAPAPAPAVEEAPVSEEKESAPETTPAPVVEEAKESVPEVVEADEPVKPSEPKEEDVVPEVKEDIVPEVKAEEPAAPPPTEPAKLVEEASAPLVEESIANESSEVKPAEPLVEETNIETSPSKEAVANGEKPKVEEPTRASVPELAPTAIVAEDVKAEDAKAEAETKAA